MARQRPEALFDERVELSAHLVDERRQHDYEGQQGKGRQTERSSVWRRDGQRTDTGQHETDGSRASLEQSR